MPNRKKLCNRRASSTSGEVSDFGYEKLVIRKDEDECFRARHSEAELIKPTAAASLSDFSAINGSRLTREFFERPCADLAKALLGKLLVREIRCKNGLRLHKAKIVETEAYVGVDDKASHSYASRMTDRNKAMFMQAGTAYVYSIYGMYECFNISCSNGAAVLIRSLEPLEGLEGMMEFRFAKRSPAGGAPNKFKLKDLCNGPSKLCQAMQISKLEFNQRDLTDVTSALYVTDDGESVLAKNIVACPRIGLSSSAQEWRDRPLRFYIKESPFVSVLAK